MATAKKKVAKKAAKKATPKKVAKKVTKKPAKKKAAPKKSVAKTGQERPGPKGSRWDKKTSSKKDREEISTQG